MADIRTCSEDVIIDLIPLYKSFPYAQVLARTIQICDKENVKYTEGGLEAIVFTAQGDMRQALNNLQSTHNGFGEVNSQNVFKVCDEPHPMLIKDMLKNCMEGDIRKAYKVIEHLWNLGYAAEDIIKNIFKVCKNMDIEEALKLEFIKEIGLTHQRIVDELCSLLQISKCPVTTLYIAKTQLRIAWRWCTSGGRQGPLQLRGVSVNVFNRKIDILGVEIFRKRTTSVIILVVYILPSISYDEYDELFEFFENFQENHKTIIIGDFNISELHDPENPDQHSNLVSRLNAFLNYCDSTQHNKICNANNRILDLSYRPSDYALEVSRDENTLVPIDCIIRTPSKHSS
ncbi:hypothetical protein JTB14_014540 [Gonioctena quinquepunctata]|nr:hypothetical protein JTB14_014540 [Gonioctena quinquepunctata]